MGDKDKQSGSKGKAPESATTPAHATGFNSIQSNPMFNFQPPTDLDVIDKHRAENWKVFKQRWENYAIITQLNKQPEEYQASILNLRRKGERYLKQNKPTTTIRMRKTWKLYKKEMSYVCALFNSTKRHGTIKAMVRRRLDDRSYEVETDNSLYRRNRVDLKRTQEEPINKEVNIPTESSHPLPTPLEDAPMSLAPKDGTTAPPTRPARVRREPAYLEDFVRS
ncbi:hypothetical protein AC249_AIPGENE8719 [Exaiptasia diaphana]|nr:hypothetical protein AC249_AIPGENE8719 [Exaiptasia diaphana]